MIKYRGWMFFISLGAVLSFGLILQDESPPLIIMAPQPRHALVMTSSAGIVGVCDTYRVRTSLLIGEIVSEITNS